MMRRCQCHGFMIAGDPEGGGLVAGDVLQGHGNEATWLVSRLGKVTRTGSGREPDR